MTANSSNSPVPFRWNPRQELKADSWQRTGLPAYTAAGTETVLVRERPGWWVLFENMRLAEMNQAGGMFFSRKGQATAEVRLMVGG